MLNVNIHEAETIKLEWTHHEKGRRQPIKICDGHGCTWKRIGGGLDGDDSTTPEKI